MEKFSLPVIDLENYLQAEKEKLAGAVTEIGCFRVINHGIPAALMAELKAIIPELMKLPDEVKLRNADALPQSGYISANREIGLPHILESLGIFDATSPDNVEAFFSRLGIAPRHREIIIEYNSKLHELVSEVASKIADSLGAGGRSFADWPAILRLNQYDFTHVGKDTQGLNIHTDGNFLATVQEDGSVGGFQIIAPSRNLVSIDPMANAFIFNIGDMGKVWSNGRMQNVKHKVVCKEHTIRFTTTYLLLAPRDYIVEPQEEFINSKHPRLYKTIKYKDYRDHRYSAKCSLGELLSTAYEVAILE